MTTLQRSHTHRHVADCGPLLSQEGCQQTMHNQESLSLAFTARRHSCGLARTHLRRRKSGVLINMCVRAQKWIKKIVRFCRVETGRTSRPQDPGRSGSKKRVRLSTTHCSSRHRTNVPDLKNCMAQKSAAQQAAQLPNPSQVHMRVQKFPWPPPLSLQYCAPRTRGRSARRRSRWKKRVK